ncbi:MAG: nucleotidyltransferase substrate binding protein [Euryarchaeota archaeon]|nr:nucleotidyltransferase substrate binding protein [Euryarchaeota archaeon]MBU4339340.1 nucleotidyltransferase substrate binding protein [Euryarchaeota archaeon]MBU4454873.1 nucleotidyltransferase substrate binding protein [Euryarchaeota archaeon]MCG2738280.1 nucleotidyltransferase substrate binding protein [Candidatus Methanoperedenaceae archaeon]
MEKLNLVAENAGRALTTLKENLKEREGIICASPKSYFREAFKVKLLTEEETVKALEMTDDRNLTSHTYHEEVAMEIYQKIRGYYELMDKVHRTILEKTRRN